VPYELEAKINNIPGVVENGIFANRKADTIICAKANSIEIIQ
jgi:ribose 5-phosphate isomerase A